MLSEPLIPKWYKFDGLFKSRILLIGLIFFHDLQWFTMLTSENKSLVIYALDTEREAVDVWNEWVDRNYTCRTFTDSHVHLFMHFI